MRIIALLLAGLALCGCDKIARKFAQRPPAPWTDYNLSYEIHDAVSGGGSAMEVYKGSETRGGSSGNSGNNASAHFRVADILPTGVHLEVDIGGDWSSDGRPVPFHVTKTYFVPYKGTTSLRITKDLTLDLEFMP